MLSDTAVEVLALITGVESLLELWEVESTDAELCKSADDNIEWPDIHVLDLDC